MAGKKKDMQSAIEVIEEDTGKKGKGSADNACPICGAPNGRLKCDKCGWSIEELGPDYSISGEDPVKTLSKAKHTFKAMKDELRNLREQNIALMTNNQKFAQLVESMEKQLKALRAEMGRKYVYSYNAGGWGQMGDIDRTRLDMKKKTVTVSDINNQLAEIMRLLRRYKK